jgi:hypothetical protein
LRCVWCQKWYGAHLFLREIFGIGWGLLLFGFYRIVIGKKSK